MSAFDSPIIRVSTGKLNTVNDALIGGVSGGTGAFSKYRGQLGKTLWVSPDQISMLFLSSVGTLYGGRYRYVRMRAADVDSPDLQVGQILFWDTTVTNWTLAYQVTRSADLSSTANGMFIAGVYLGGFTPGNYGFIQDLGVVPIKFRETLTVSPSAPGGRVYVADLGATDSEGLGDTVDTDATSVVNARYLGVAVTTPTANSLTPVLINPHNALGMA